MKKLIAIVGPTASGKSNVAIELAKQCNGEIISADSAQVYKGLDIGTAKVSNSETQGIKHYLIDIVGAETEYNVGEFQKDAQNAIDEITAKGKMPILCGGSGLYVNSVINEGYDLGLTQGDPKKRKELAALEKEHGQGYLYGILAEKFPNRAKKIHENDYQRILRGLEMDADIDENYTVNRWSSPYDLQIFGLQKERKLLYQGIDERVDNMFELGLIEEVAAALSMGYNPKGNALMALGYKEILPLLYGNAEVEEAKNTLKLNTRHFAKRQLTWFRRDPRIIWYDVGDFANIAEISFAIFTKLKQDKFII
ncbi:MAG: tRNA (adenosine(37)-N6)-dimethylallyltransferase MiaA [Clostridiales bacterium]